MNLSQKLLEVKKRVPYLQKDEKSFQYSYASPTQVLGTINPLLNEMGVILISEVVSVTTERIKVKPKYHEVFKGKEKDFILADVYETMFNLTMKMTWKDVETDEEISVNWFASGVNGDEKGFGSALTYAERYFILKQFNIPTDSDDPDSFQTKNMTEDEKAKWNDRKNVEAIKKMIDNAKTKEDLSSVYKANKAWFDAYPELTDHSKSQADKLGIKNEKKTADKGEDKTQEGNAAPQEATPAPTEETPADETAPEPAPEPEPIPEKKPRKSKKEQEMEEANFAGMKKNQQPVEDIPTVEAEELPLAAEGIDVDSEIEALDKFTDVKSVILHSRRVVVMMESSGVDSVEINRYKSAANVICTKLKG